jgi:hypothetical protein
MGIKNPSGFGNDEEVGGVALTLCVGLRYR